MTPASILLVGRLAADRSAVVDRLAVADPYLSAAVGRLEAVDPYLLAVVAHL